MMAKAKKSFRWFFSELWVNKKMVILLILILCGCYYAGLFQALWEAFFPGPYVPNITVISGG